MTQPPQLSDVTHAQQHLQGIGRIGHLHLEYRRHGHRTDLVYSSGTTPWHVLPPCYPDDEGYAYSLLVNPSGGLVGGDHLSLRAVLGEASHVLMSTPSATRLYRSCGDVAVQKIHLDVGAAAVLEWLPDLALPYAGSRYRQTIDVRLGTGATLFLWDAMASGRIARGERWAFEEFYNEIRITTARSTLVTERYRLTPVTRPEWLGLALHAWDYVGTFLVVQDGLERTGAARLADHLHALTQDTAEALAGVTVLASHGVVVKLVAKSGLVLSRLFESIWRVLRLELMGLRYADLRRY